MDSELLFYEKQDSTEDKLKDKNTVRCRLCPHNCILTEGRYGVCRVRTLKDNVPVAVNYGEVTSAGVDPIEKKPLYHFKPSKNILSVGTFGCNITCSFCQNYEISQNRPPSEFIDAERLIEIMRGIENNAGIAFTYNEPFMWYEYVYETLKDIKEKYAQKELCNDDISTVIVTNGYINKEPLLNILPYVDAMNIDLKAYTNRYYNKICGASLDPVLETIKTCRHKCHVEITTLLVSDENDSIEEVREIAQFISSVNDEMPLHLSRYFPRYKMNNEATQIEKLMDAKHEAEKYLKYVYVGNVPGTDNNTYCPRCQELLVQRTNYNTKLLISTDKCPACGEKINIHL